MLVGDHDFIVHPVFPILANSVFLQGEGVNRMHPEESLPLDDDDPRFRQGYRVQSKCARCRGEGTIWKVEKDDLLAEQPFYWQSGCRACDGIGFFLECHSADAGNYVEQTCPECTGERAIFCHGSVGSVPVEAWYEPCASCGGRGFVFVPSGDFDLEEDGSDPVNVPF